MAARIVSVENEVTLEEYLDLQSKPGKRLTQKAVEGDSSLESQFDYFLTILGPDIPKPVPQYKIERYFIDRAWPEFSIAVELNGGAGGGYGQRVICNKCHTPVRARKKDGTLGKELRMPYPSHSGAGAERDALKFNLLTQLGWRVFVVTSNYLKENPEAVIGMLRVEIRKARESMNRPAVIDLPVFTKRELDVLQMIAIGKSYAEIALAIGLSVNTVEKYAENIRTKLDVASTTAAAVKAYSLGLIRSNIF